MKYKYSRKRWFQKHGMRITGLNTGEVQTNAYNDLLAKQSKPKKVSTATASASNLATAKLNVDSNKPPTPPVSEDKWDTTQQDKFIEKFKSEITTGNPSQSEDKTVEEKELIEPKLFKIMGRLLEEEFCHIPFQYPYGTPSQLSSDKCGGNLPNTKNKAGGSSKSVFSSHHQVRPKTVEGKIEPIKKMVLEVYANDPVLYELHKKQCEIIDRLNILTSNAKTK